MLPVPTRAGFLAQAACVSIVLALHDSHDVSFEDASTVFGDPLSLTIPDPAHSQAEDRFIIIGRSHQQELLIVVHTEQGDNIRVISARRASRSERKRYEESN
jgi:uncharacterized DUF497 family protein